MLSGSYLSLLTNRKSWAQVIDEVCRSPVPLGVHDSASPRVLCFSSVHAPSAPKRLASGTRWGEQVNRGCLCGRVGLGGVCGTAGGMICVMYTSAQGRNKTGCAFFAFRRMANGSLFFFCGCLVGKGFISALVAVCTMKFCTMKFQVIMCTLSSCLLGCFSLNFFFALVLAFFILCSWMGCGVRVWWAGCTRPPGVSWVHSSPQVRCFLLANLLHAEAFFLYVYVRVRRRKKFLIRLCTNANRKAVSLTCCNACLYWSFGILWCSLFFALSLSLLSDTRGKGGFEICDVCEIRCVTCVICMRAMVFTGNEREYDLGVKQNMEEKGLATTE